MSAIVDTSPDTEDLVRLDNLQGADEANIAGRSFRRDHLGAFWIPRRFVTDELRNIGGFFERPLTHDEALADVERAVSVMPASGHKMALIELLADLGEPRSL